MRALLVVPILSGLASAEVRKVPAEYATIQAAIDASVDGDEVVVAPGLYLENLRFRGKDVVLRSQAGPGVTTIDGGGLDTVVLFEGGESNAAVLRGFTLTHGRGTGEPFSNLTKGGAVTCRAGSAPTVEGNVMRDNAASWGGGLLAWFAAPIVRGNVFEKNSIVHFGGGVLFQESDGVVEGNLFQDNIAGFPTGSGSAAGMYVAALSEPRIERNVFRRNIARGSGGGMAINNSDLGANPHHALVRHNVFEENVAGSHAGGLWITRSVPHLEGNVFRANEADQGGGLVILDSEVTLRGDVLVDNRAVDSGGGLFARVDASVHLVRTSFVGNQAGEGGAALWGSSATLDIVSSLLWRNVAGTGAPVRLDSTDLALRHSLLEGGASSVSMASGSSLQLGSGMLDLDPRLDPSAELPLLAADSPCIDAGDPTDHPLARDASRAPALQDGDLDGVLRVDVGALEFTHVRLEAHLEGTELVLKAMGTPGQPALLLVGGPAEPAPFGDRGLLLVSAPPAILLLGTLPVSERLDLPPDFLRNHPVFALQVMTPLEAGRGNTSNDVVLSSPEHAARRPR